MSLVYIYNEISDLFRGPSFRTEYQNIGEARSVMAQGVNVMALTATASPRTRQVIQDSLAMHNCRSIVKAPNRPNIRYIVRRKPNNFDEILPSIVHSSDKCIVFCRTYDDAVSIHECIANALGDCLFVDGKPACKIFSGSLHSDDKSRILCSFTQPNSMLRIVVATIAFGMGIDVPNVCHIIHWSPSKTIEAYIQESG